MLWGMLPLAAFAGLRLLQNDKKQCAIGLRYGYLTKNPFKSIYFAAQAMAAEMSTGLPALLWIRGRKANVSMLVTGLEARFVKKAVGRIQFTFADKEALEACLEQLLLQQSTAEFTAISKGTNEAGEVVAEFHIHWSFKAKSK
jgi:hypothetical protein